MNSSPKRGTFQIECQLKHVEEGEKTMEQAEEMIEFYKSWDVRRRELEQTDEWKVNNMEYDLRSCKWICDKAKQSEAYAQNLYAAICNNDFTKNDVWPLLQGKTWSASWRSAGGIVANMIEKGDYIDWYCSGIRNHDPLEDGEWEGWTLEQQTYYKEGQAFVGEGLITDEIKADLKKLNWIFREGDNDSWI